MIDHYKPKVPEKRVPIDPQIAAKVYACLNNPPPPNKLPLDYDRTLIKAQEKRKKKCGKTIPQLGTVQKEILPLLVPREPNQTEAEFLWETGFTLEQAEGRTEDLPKAIVVNIPFQLGKLFVTDEEEINLGTQMFNLHRWYMRMSNDEMDMFGVRVYFELLHHIYQRQALDISIITIWVL